MAASSAFERIVDALRAEGAVVRETGTDRAMAQCPSHDDRNPSLSLFPRTDNRGVKLKCHAGCDDRDVLAALRFTVADLFDEPLMREAFSPSRDYTYSDGRVVHRKPGKVFRQSGNRKGTVLFHKEKIGEATTVAVVEGEKDVEAIEAAGGVAVSSAMGAGKAKLADWSPLTGKRVVIIADKDDAGREHARQVATLLKGVAASIEVKEAVEGKDAADHILAGHTLAEFAPAAWWTSAPPPGTPGTNGHRRDTDLAELLDFPKGKAAPSLEDIEADFWEARDNHNLIYQAALSRMASPWAVLACCVTRILCLIPPATVLPPVIGGPGSLNWFAALTAKSGGGKGAAMDVARQLVPGDILVRSIGSGEGMIEVYQRGKTTKDPPPPVVSVMFSVDEIDTLTALGGRSGQTTLSILRQGFSGETLGFSYRGRLSESVSAHTYRMTLVASVQPERAGVLFDSAGGGTPQRFMWFPARDRRITSSPPPWPETYNGDPRQIPLLSAQDLARCMGQIPIPPVAAQAIREARAASMGGDDNALDSHALFCREKFAYALSVIDGRTTVTEEDWDLAGIAADVSDWIRAKAHTAYLESKRQQARDRGEMRGVENRERDITEQIEKSRQTGRLALWVNKTLRTKGPMTPGQLNRSADSRDRPALPAAYTLAADHGLIIFSELDHVWRPL